MKLTWWRDPSTESLETFVKDFGLYQDSSGKPLNGFKQGDDLIRLVFLSCPFNYYFLS